MKHLQNVVLATIFLVAFLLPHLVNAQSYAEQVWEQLQDDYDYFSEYEDYYLLNYVIGTLDEDAKDYWTWNLYTGDEYLITAACDYDCDDIDITIKDSYGNILQEDTRTDDQPYVEFSPSASGEYQIEIHMYSCSEEPCYYGFGIFVK